MTEKRIRAIAARMWSVFLAKSGMPGAVDFASLSDHAQVGWIAAARIAVSELRPKPTKSARWPNRAVKPRACRVGPGGKHTCT